MGAQSRRCSDSLSRSWPCAAWARSGAAAARRSRAIRSSPGARRRGRGASRAAQLRLRAARPRSRCRARYPEPGPRLGDGAIEIAVAGGVAATARRSSRPPRIETSTGRRARRRRAETRVGRSDRGGRCRFRADPRGLAASPSGAAPLQLRLEAATGSCAAPGRAAGGLRSLVGRARLLRARSTTACTCVRTRERPSRRWSVDVGGRVLDPAGRICAADGARRKRRTRPDGVLLIDRRGAGRAGRRPRQRCSACRSPRATKARPRSAGDSRRAGHRRAAGGHADADACCGSTPAGLPPPVLRQRHGGRYRRCRCRRSAGAVRDAASAGPAHDEQHVAGRDLLAVARSASRRPRPPPAARHRRRGSG